MRKLICTSLAAVGLMIGVSLSQPAHAQMNCWSGPLGLLHGCNYSPYAPYAPYAPYYYPPPAYYYPPPPAVR